MVISDEKAAQFLKEILEENYFPSVTESDIPEFIDMYHQVKFEESQTFKNESDLKTLLGNLVEAEDNYRRGEGSGARTELNRYSSNKHMYAFDDWLEKGASTDIVNALNKFGLNADALKGLKFGTEVQKLGSEEKGKDTKYLNQSLDNGVVVKIRYIDDPSFSITDFEILKFNDNTNIYDSVYKWNRENGSAWNESIDVPQEEHTGFQGYQVRTDKRGRQYAMDEKGHRVKKKFWSM